MVVAGPDASVNLELDLQIAPEIQEIHEFLPGRAMIELWISATLSAVNISGDNQLTVRIVDETEIKTLNETYRHKLGVTNVLSFPFESPPDVPIPLVREFLGDIVICAPVVQHEAQQQQKSVENHWAHLIVHGTLHLLGYDHLSEQQADEMETMEIKILSEFGVPNPYRETQA